jgi:hypothetical protein
MSDADDIRDQFGERLWKTPDELNRDRSMEVAKGNMMDKGKINREIHELRGLGVGECTCPNRMNLTSASIWPLLGFLGNNGHTLRTG